MRRGHTRGGLTASPVWYSLETSSVLLVNLFLPCFFYSKVEEGVGVFLNGHLGFDPIVEMWGVRL